MNDEFCPLKSHNVVALVKACAEHRDLDKGLKIHAYIQEHKLLEKDCYLASALVNMYARCGALGKGQQVLNELPVRNVVMWNALITGYAQQGHGEEALKCFDSMQREGHSPNVVTFICALKACGSIGAVSKIHARILSLGLLEKNIVLGSTLVDMYARCGVVTKAQQVLDELPVRDAIMWTSLIAGYTQQEHAEEALQCFESMQYEGHCPDAVTFVWALKASGSIGAIAEGKQIHDKILNLGMMKENVVLGSALVDMYARCGVLEKVQEVFSEASARDVIMWTTVIAAYGQQGQGENALKCFDNMQQDDCIPNTVTFVCALKACASIGSTIKGEQIHDNILRLGLLEKDLLLGSTLVDMYATCGALTKAQQVLDELPVQNVIMWTALIAGYVQQGQGEEALKCFDRMQREGHCPNVVALICALKACGSIRAASKGEKIHDKIATLGILGKDNAIGNALVDMYAKCGSLAKAQQVFDELFARDVITWNALIGGYIQQGQWEEALKCFDRMQDEGHSPDEVTFICAIKACGSIGAISRGDQIHDKIVGLGLLGKSTILESTVVDMYVRCGALGKAQEALDKLPVRSKVTWNTLIEGYTQLGQGEAALKCFDSMLDAGCFPDAAIFISALKACGSIAAVTKGEEIHNEIVHLGLLEKDIVLGNTLLGMYAKCGALAKAVNVVEQLPFQDITTWNALIGAYGQQGQGGEALNCFKEMQSKGIKPDSATLVCMLNACSHSGLLDQANVCFFRMHTEYNIAADVEHICCMLDVYGCAREYNKALAIVERMSCSDYCPVWLAMLGACCKWGDVKIGRLAFERAYHLDQNNAVIYVCMANIYLAAGMQENGEYIEAS